MAEQIVITNYSCGLASSGSTQHCSEHRLEMVICCVEANSYSDTNNKDISRSLSTLTGTNGHRCNEEHEVVQH